jgi:hypothetical protein
MKVDLPAIGGVALVGLSRYLFRSHLLYDLDSVNFALGMARFDPSVNQPHPPGYFLYVMLARVVNVFTHDANAAMVAMSIVASCGAAWLIYLLGREWFSREVGRIALVLFLISPLSWFHGTVALTYIVEAFFSALLGLLCWRAFGGEGRWALAASLVFGLAAGFRPSGALLLAPLWLLSQWRIPNRWRIASVGVLAVVTTAWFLPMMAAAGGAGGYAGALGRLWSGVAAKQTVFTNPGMVFNRMSFLAAILVLVLGSVTPLVLLSRTGKVTMRRGGAMFAWVWITPGLLFFSLVFLWFVNSGYTLLLTPPIFVWTAARVQAFLLRMQRPARLIAASIGIAINVAVYLWVPAYCSARGVRLFESELQTFTREFRQHYDPAKTVIVAFNSHFMGSRHAGYYLPEFLTLEYPELEDHRVWVMRGRDTQRAASVAVSGYESFVIFPLPEGEENSAYLRHVLAEMSHVRLQGEILGGKQVLRGASADLPRMFPNTVR